MTFEDIIETIGEGLDLVGVAIIAAAVALGLGLYVVRTIRPRTGSDAYRDARHVLGKGILLGLEVLVGADIVRTVAVEPSFRTVGVLAAIVLIRTFLSASLEMEIEGKPPWRRAETRG